MKKVFLFGLIILLGCAKPQPNKYTLRIDENDDRTKGVHSYYTVTILAMNDTQAYFKAVKRWYSNPADLKVYGVLPFKSFVIKNAAGDNLAVTLPKRVRDSIMMIWRLRFSNIPK